MMADAKAGKIDLIITKSVSRFARNAKDFLDAVSDLDDAITENTFKMRELIADAEDLLHTVPEECRETAKRVYEALRYSDPVSAPGTEEAEDRIATQFYAFRDSALEGDHELAPRLADALFGLIEDRNRLCKQKKKNLTEDVK